MAENREHDRPPVPYEPVDLSNPENRFEKTDVDIRAISKFGIALTLLCVGSFAIVIGVFHYFRVREEAAQVSIQVQRPTDARRLPPEPRLQATEALDLKDFRAAEDRILNSYSWVDQQQGLVRIPVSQAMDLLAQRGLPSRQGPAIQSAANGITVPTESGLGPKVQQAGGPLASDLQMPAAPPQPSHPSGNPASDANRPAEQPSVPAGHSPGAAEKKH